MPYSSAYIYPSGIKDIICEDGLLYDVQAGLFRIQIYGDNIDAISILKHLYVTNLYNSSRV